MKTCVSKRNDLIDLIRFVSSIFVLLIHCPFPGFLGEAIITFGRYAVPYFLMVSGWFFYSADPNRMLEKAKKQLFETAKLTGIFAGVYFIANSICSAASNGQFYSWVLTYCNLKTALYFILFNRALFFGSTGYYIFMLLYIYVIVMLCIKLKVYNWVPYLAPFLLAVNIYLGEFTDLPWFVSGNFLFTGLPCFALGYLLRRSDRVLCQIDAIKWMMLFVLGVIMSYIEMHATQAAYCHVGSIIMAGSLLMFSVRSTLSYGSSIIRVLRRYATVIFVTHCGVRDLLNTFLGRMNIVCDDWLLPFVVIIASLVVCVLWDIIQIMCNSYANRQG